MHETDRPNPDQGSPEWAVTVDARDLHDVLTAAANLNHTLRTNPAWQRLDEACSTAGEAQPVNVPAVRCLVKSPRGTMLDVWLPMGIATDVPLSFVAPCTITLMPIDGTGVGGHGIPQEAAETPPPPPSWHERMSSFQVSEAEFLSRYGIESTDRDRGTAVEIDVTHGKINLHVMLEGGPPYEVGRDEARLLALDLVRACRMWDER